MLWPSTNPHPSGSPFVEVLPFGDSDWRTDHYPLCVLRGRPNARRLREFPPQKPNSASRSVVCKFEVGEVVQLVRVERTTSGSTIRRSNQLSYSCTEAREIIYLPPQKQAGEKRAGKEPTGGPALAARPARDEKGSETDPGPA